MNFADIHFPDNFTALANDVLVWVGFGTLVGLLAKAIMPGRDPGGAMATLLMGIGGTVIGCGVVSFLTDGKRITPISPIGFLVATGGAFIILFFYKMLSGYFFSEGGTSRYGNSLRGYGAGAYGRRRRSGGTTIIEERV